MPGTKQDDLRIQVEASEESCDFPELAERVGGQWNGLSVNLHCKGITPSVRSTPGCQVWMKADIWPRNPQGSLRDVVLQSAFTMSSEETATCKVVVVSSQNTRSMNATRIVDVFIALCENREIIFDGSCSRVQIDKLRACGEPLHYPGLLRISCFLEPLCCEIFQLHRCCCIHCSAVCTEILKLLQRSSHLHAFLPRNSRVTF